MASACLIQERVLQFVGYPGKWLRSCCFLFTQLPFMGRLKNSPGRNLKRRKRQYLSGYGTNCPMPDPVPEKVQANVERLRCGEKLPPVTVCFDGSDYWLRDGFHRVEAARQVGLGNIEAEIIPGTLDEMEQEWKKMLREALKRLAREA